MAGQKRIIIAEDDVVLRDVLAGKLVKNGYIVDRAEDGVVALAKMREVTPDCVLLDILMPRKGGIEVLEEMNQDPALKGVATIIISNSGQPVEIARARELGARDFLIKAVFDPSEVLEKVRRVLEEGNTSASDEGNDIMRRQNVTATGAVSLPEETAPASKEESVASATAGKKVFVLVIEDDKFLRELLVRKLSGEGFEVKNAIDAEIAFAVLAERTPDIILLDLILPGVDGFEILTRIKANPKIANIPVIILSNLGQKDDLEKAMALGAKDFMVKANFTLDEIVAKVHSVVG
jgi:CheY-like chemotaxis protein